MTNTDSRISGRYRGIILALKFAIATWAAIAALAIAVVVYL